MTVDRRPYGAWTPSAWQSLFLDETRPYVLLADDPRFHLSAGDTLLCMPYHLDPDKLTVVARESDGFEPGCNVYRSQVTRKGSSS